MAAEDKVVTFTISKGGKIAVDMDGFHGQGCSELQDQITERMGAKVVDEEVKPEYYDDNCNVNTLTSGR